MTEIRLTEQSDRPEEILTFLRDSLLTGRGCALVTLTEIVDGAARMLGAHMAVREDGAYCGYVSGGCVEAAVAAEACEAIACGQDRFVRYGQGSPYFDIVLPCGGGIGVWIHPLRNAEPIVQVVADLLARHPSALAYDPTAQTLRLCEPAAESGWHDGVFISTYRPPLRMVLIGQGLEGRLFSRIAAAAGIEVVLETRQGAASARADQNTAVVFLQHDVDREIDVLRQALASDAFYIGCLGGRRTHGKRVALLTQAGVAADDIARIHAPIGLFGPARDAASVAFSVLAQVMKERGQHTVFAL
jgi:xanthine dehydrogenase accessory factor